VPIQAPDEIPVQAPVEVPVQAPVEVPVQAPVEVSVQAPVEVSVQVQMPGQLEDLVEVQVHDHLVGMIQCYRHKDYPDWEREVGIEGGAEMDYLVGDPNFTGIGIGVLAIRAIVEIAFGMYPDTDVVLSVQQKDNRASWRALEKTDFNRVDERKLDSDCPSDEGVSYIYVLRRGD
jgi:RimJ/RimL family protein N-acetyltransferase